MDVFSFFSSSCCIACNNAKMFFFLNDDENGSHRRCYMLFRRTALAEAELEYNEGHVSTSVYIKFPITHLPESLQGQLGRYRT